MRTPVEPDWPHVSPTMWGWHQTDANRVGDDLVSLEPYQNYIDDPTLIQTLMENQGVENISSVEIGEQMSGGSSTNNYKAYINWDDGTQTEVVLKGRRPLEAATASYRESLFYSRMSDSVTQWVNMPQHYLAVADVVTGDALFMEKFMTGYVSMQDLFTASANGTLDQYGIDPSTWSDLEQQKDIFKLMGKWAGSHWMDQSLYTEFWMKNYDEVQGHGVWDQRGQHDWFEWNWNKARDFLAAGTVTWKVNTIECIEAIFDAWTLDNVLAEWSKPEYRWGLTHGDFHPGQVLVDPNNLEDKVVIDYEFAGMMGSPAIDMVTWTFLYCTQEFLAANEEKLIQSYWSGLIETGVDPLDYPYEQLLNDYLIYGSSQIAARQMWIAGALPAQSFYDLFDDWFDRWNLTPDMMTAPVYGTFDAYV